ncbi:hypothetical protein [Haladaptatus halobius]|uniref:hypothetical protein n=1 Tax=Haladaptatus halobius TaxID=2884875 RepID=UPI001D09CBBC|nr:hypothetical protein [Haladaptatus halobius]
MTRLPSVESIAVIGPVLEAFVTVRPILATVGAFSRIAGLLVTGVSTPETATEATSLSPGTSCQR